MKKHPADRSHGTALVAVAALVVLTAGANPSVAVAKESARSNASALLRGTTTVRTGPSSSAVTVQLPKDMYVASIDVEMRGRGRILGFALRELDREEGAVLYGFISNRCIEERCTAPPTGRIERGLGYTDETLPAGRYRMDLLADGSPTSYVFRFPGLSGRTKLAPSRPSDATIRTGVPSVYNSSDETIYAAGAYEDRAQFAQGVAYMAMWIETQEAPLAWDICPKGNYSPAPAPPEELMFYPGCGASERSVIPPDTDGGLFTSTVTDLANPAGQGGWWVVKTPPIDRGVVAAWIPF